MSDQIDISFTPYYHPILPLLCDTDVAREAIPNIELPKKRFRHPEDARDQIRMAAAKYQELFDRPLRGMWPSEGSVSEEVASLCAEEGLQWIATDEEILFHSLNKSGLDPAAHPLQSVYEYQGTPGLKLFFRDHALSDRIGFVYSGWDTERAVDDFIDSLKKIRQGLAGRLEESVVSVILDGENVWEYFPGDGHEFLDALYHRLGSDDEIETVTMSDAAASVPARPLKRLFAGSWINHNFRIWIGHQQDNAAWDLLSETRDVLVQFEKDNSDFPEDKIRAAWKQIYIAEGSDWNWWYGDEHRSDFSDQFDRIYRLHLIAVYQILGLEIPVAYLSPIREATRLARFSVPDSLISPDIDGRLTHFYEWTGAGRFDCRLGGGAMHRMDQIVGQVWVGFDYDALYIRLDFDNVKNLDLLKSLRFRLAFYTPDLKVIEVSSGMSNEAASEKRPYRSCLKDILEVAVDRDYLWPNGFGSTGLLVSVQDGAETLETWPEQEPLEIIVPEKNKEMFWPS